MGIDGWIAQSIPVDNKWQSIDRHLAQSLWLAVATDGHASYPMGYHCGGQYFQSIDSITNQSMVADIIYRYTPSAVCCL